MARWCDYHRRCCRLATRIPWSRQGLRLPQHVRHCLSHLGVMWAHVRRPQYLRDELVTRVWHLAPVVVPLAMALPSVCSRRWRSTACAWVFPWPLTCLLTIHKEKWLECGDVKYHASQKYFLSKRLQNTVSWTGIPTPLLCRPYHSHNRAIMVFSTPPLHPSTSIWVVFLKQYLQHFYYSFVSNSLFKLLISD
jgi:hypothetical protein